MLLTYYLAILKLRNNWQKVKNNYQRCSLHFAGVLQVIIDKHKTFKVGLSAEVHLVVWLFE